MNLADISGDGCAALCYLTSDLPGVGGSIKNRVDDFVVEEIPRYEACGEGTHVFFMIEKRGLTTRDAIGRISRALGCKRHDVGYAGLKDSRGVTRQVLSVEHVEPDRVLGLSVGQIQILWAVRHGNKLRLGHLAGNRFTIRVRDMDAGSYSRAAAIVEKLIEKGMPNYFGPQRFGMRGTNAMVGRAALTGDYQQSIALILGKPQPADPPDVQQARTLFDGGLYSDAAAAWPPRFRDERNLCRRVASGEQDAGALWRSIDRSLRNLFLSAFQSFLFNRVVAARIDRLDEVVQGDLAWLHRNGACFQVEDVAAELLRCESFEISPTGPMFGRKMTPASGVAGELENRVLIESGLTPNGFSDGTSDKLSGARRPLRVPVGEAGCVEGEDANGGYLELRFALPPGSYATSLVREICKV